MSPPDFLDRLDLTPAERRTLAGLGAGNALTLAHMIRASRRSFQQTIGDVDRAEHIEHQLRTILSDDERVSLDTAEAPPPFALGARLEPPPKLRDED